MADKTAIEWTDATWNPITGCSIVSPGCRDCYAMRLAGTRLRNHPTRAGLTDASKAGPVWNGKVRFNERTLTDPLRWKKPRRIFVCAHGDLFHENVPDAWIDRVFAIMALAPHHTFQVLTKRSARRREYLSDQRTVRNIYELVCDIAIEQKLHVVLIHPAVNRSKAPAGPRIHLDLWPLPNVWLGVSVEDQRRAEERIWDLLATPTAIRWISAEPLLGPIDIRQWQHLYGCGCGWGGDVPLDYCSNCGWRGDAGGDDPLDCPECGEPIEDYQACPECDGHDGDGMSFGPNSRPSLDWVVAGGESGPTARPMHPAWVRSLRDQCAAAGVPFLFKQWGEHRPLTRVESGQACGATRVEDPDAGHALVLKVGKKRAGRLLDGRLHDAFPETRPAANEGSRT